MVKKLVEKWAPAPHQSFTYYTYPMGDCPEKPDESVLRVHDEYEITFIDNCSGTRYIGNSIEKFTHCDLFLIGPRLQHRVQLPEGKRGRGTTIHFLERSFGQGFWVLPECGAIRQLLEDAAMGVAFPRKALPEARRYFRKLATATGFARMLILFQFLEFMATCSGRRQLCSHAFAPVVHRKDHAMVNRAYEYIMSRFREERIALADIAEHLSMSPATFCRYFKKHFKMTFTAFLNEVRVGHACKLLQDTEYNIAEVAFSSGYRQLTHFNRQFKRVTKLTPKEYRKQLAYTR